MNQRKYDLLESMNSLDKIPLIHEIAKVVEEAKKSSSKWMKEKGIKRFTWQIGYAAFSVSGSKVVIDFKHRI